MRYFFVAYTFRDHGMQKFSSITFTAEDMPNLMSIAYNIQLNFPLYEEIFVLSISEWSKEDYFKLIEGENPTRN